MVEWHIFPFSRLAGSRRRPRAACGLFALLASCAVAGNAHGQPPAAPAANVQVIDLASALKLAGVENRDILIARQRVVESLAQRQRAASQFLPSLNAGLNYDAHTGPLQQASGNILSVNREALNLGAGTNAVAAGTVNIPGLVYDVNVSQTIYGFLLSRQEVNRRRFGEAALTNEMLRRVGSAYLDLLRAEALRSLTLQARNEAQIVYKVCKDWSDVKQGRQADAERAKTELDNRRIDHLEAEVRILTASARLAELLNIPPSIRLHPAEERLVPLSVVPDPVPLCQLLAVALLNRPELAERRVAVRQALTELSAAKILPFSPNVITGLSSGVFGGGSNTTDPRFGSFDNRDDLDVVVYWTLQNLGIANDAMIKIAASHTRSANLEQVRMLNLVRTQVAQAFVRKQTAYDQMLIAEKAVPIGLRALTLDYQRVKNVVKNALPIELLDSFRLVNQARRDYLDAIVAYNQAQLDLYVAIGQPPADVLARPVPTSGVGPSLQDRKLAP